MGQAQNLGSHHLTIAQRCTPRLLKMCTARLKVSPSEFWTKCDQSCSQRSTIQEIKARSHGEEKLNPKESFLQESQHSSCIPLFVNDRPWLSNRYSNDRS
jgi:hypothetical protein